MYLVEHDFFMAKTKIVNTLRQRGKGKKARTISGNGSCICFGKQFA
jgi:hypothetical protein